MLRHVLWSDYARLELSAQLIALMTLSRISTQTRSVPAGLAGLVLQDLDIISMSFPSLLEALQPDGTHGEHCVQDASPASQVAVSRSTRSRRRLIQTYPDSTERVAHCRSAWRDQGVSDCTGSRTSDIENVRRGQHRLHGAHLHAYGEARNDNGVSAKCASRAALAVLDRAGTPRQRVVS